MRLILGDTPEQDRLALEAGPQEQSEPVELHPDRSLQDYCNDYCIKAVFAESLVEISRTFACRLHLFTDGLYQEKIGRAGVSIFSKHPVIDFFAAPEKARPEISVLRAR
jgi:hypothetical protein